MNTNALKKFAREARIKLLDLVETKIDFVLSTDTGQLRGMSKQIDELREQIKTHGKEQVVEKVSYTWFNRLMALRFMDANGYNSPMVVTPAPGGHVPEILQEAKVGIVSEDLQFDRARLNDLLDGKTQVADAQTEAYKILLIASCNALYNVMPFMFERISDYTELLLPDDLLSEFSIVTDIRERMSDEDCKQEEVIGWLYQFYISEKNERLIKSKNVYEVHELAPASQLFTPKWIVRYMVDNTLGQLWSEMNASTTILGQLDFYIKPTFAEQMLHRAKKRLEEIKFFEPCVGSGHILSYAFDVFYLMYEEEGYNANEIPELIIKNNLFGIDIDERAGQIASFVLMMKARRKNSRFLKKRIVPNITFYENFENDINFKNSQALGSLIHIEASETYNLKSDENFLFAERQGKLSLLYRLLGQRYDCVVTNPPYIASDRMEASVKKFVEVKYPDSRSDLFATFITRCLELSTPDGLAGYMTPFVWMFISSYRKLRENIIDHHFINNLVQLEYSGFDGATVPICTFTLRNNKLVDCNGSYVRLSDFRGSINQAPKTLEAIRNRNCGWFYLANQDVFEQIPESPIAYWSTGKINELFLNDTFKQHGEARQGMRSGKNAKYLRLWFEVAFKKIGFSYSSYNEAINSPHKWFPYNKGGAKRRWYGNQDYVIAFDKKSYLELSRLGNHLPSKSFYFNQSISWTDITSGANAFRFYPKGFIFDGNGMSYFPSSNLLSSLGILNTKVYSIFSKIINPTLHFEVGDFRKLPYCGITSKSFDTTVQRNIQISKLDWDSFEVSWDFKQNELLKHNVGSLKIACKKYEEEWTSKFLELHRNEEYLNREFNGNYELQDVLKSEIPFKEITILSETCKILDEKLLIDPVSVLLQLFSYSVGCIFGRFSLDKPGLALANQGESIQDYLVQVQDPSFLPAEDNIVLLLDGEWFPDNIDARFKLFLKTAFGADHFDENVQYIENTIAKDIRKYFIKDFYIDHIRRYKKRPIYWMFSSSKGSFKALIYMHRYQPDTVSKLLNDYLRVYISKLESEKQTLTQTSISEGITPREKTQAAKRIVELESILKELREYETKLFDLAAKKIEIDLDDGVKVNYLKFKDVLVPIKGLEKDEE